MRTFSFREGTPDIHRKNGDGKKGSIFHDEIHSSPDLGEGLEKKGFLLESNQPSMF